MQRVGTQSCTHFSSDPLGLRRKLPSYPRADVVKVLIRNRLFVVCFHNSSALWEILYGCLSLLTGLFHCAFVIVINAEVLPEVRPCSQTAQQCELCLIFSINKQGSSRALSFPKTLSWVRKWVWASQPTSTPRNAYSGGPGSPSPRMRWASGLELRACSPADDRSTRRRHRRALAKQK